MPKLSRSAPVSITIHRMLRAQTARRTTRSQRGQSTVEYALILVAVTVLVGGVIAYLSGGGGGVITGLFDAAFDRMRSLVGG
ncbi:MAG: hypothetical protein GX868_02650 [Actinobacteria bacterium]|nr:hypothetical protein [Actinomycetota bacterium]